MLRLPSWTPIWIFLLSQIDFRPNDARLVLQTHAWQMHRKVKPESTETWSSSWSKETAQKTSDNFDEHL